MHVKHLILQENTMVRTSIIFTYKANTIKCYVVCLHSVDQTLKSEKSAWPVIEFCSADIIILFYVGMYLRDRSSR